MTIPTVQLGSDKASPPRVPAWERVAAVLTCLACLALLVIAARLTPRASGHGTHEQLGLRPCAWLAVTGYPCATCGMTTAFSHAAHREPVSALRAQPMGAALAVATAMGVWMAGHVAVTGSRVGHVIAHGMTSKAIWSLAVLWAGSWAYKIGTWNG